MGGCMVWWKLWICLIVFDYKLIINYLHACILKQMCYRWLNPLPLCVWEVIKAKFGSSVALWSSGVLSEETQLALEGQEMPRTAASGTPSKKPLCSFHGSNRAVIFQLSQPDFCLLIIWFNYESLKQYTLKVTHNCSRCWRKSASAHAEKTHTVLASYTKRKKGTLLFKGKTESPGTEEHQSGKKKLLLHRWKAVRK